MKKIALILLLSFLISNIAFAQLSNDVTGNTWTRINNEQRTIYLRGLYAAITMCGQEPSQYVPFVNNFDKTREALRRFYVPRSNLKIAVSAALMMIKMEEDGKTKEEIQSFRENYEFGGWRR